MCYFFALFVDKALLTGPGYHSLRHRSLITIICPASLPADAAFRLLNQPAFWQPLRAEEVGGGSGVEERAKGAGAARTVCPAASCHTCVLTQPTFALNYRGAIVFGDRSLLQGLCRFSKRLFIFMLQV